MTFTLDLVVDAPAWERVADLQGLAERAAAAALAEAGTALPAGAELSCLFCDDAAIRALNAQWRGKDRPTNVLSFPAPKAPAGAPPVLGDVVLAFETVEREAREENRAFEAHVSHLLVHGVLHLLGHDHEDGLEADAMEALETRALRRLGFPDPYADSLPDTPMAHGPEGDAS